MKHLERTNVCDPILQDKDVKELLNEFAPVSKKYKCASCGKGFSHDSSLCRHKKKCASGTSDQNENKDDVIQALGEKLSIFEKRLSSLQRCDNQTTNVTGNNNVTMNNGNTYVVVLNNFWSEDVSHVIHDKKFLDECLKTLHKGIPNVVEKIYYDESKPENKTVVLKSSKRQTALVHTDGKWVEKHLNQVVPDMVHKGSRILTEHLITTNDDADVRFAKIEYINNVETIKKPEYDVVSSAVKTCIHHHRSRRSNHTKMCGRNLCFVEYM